MKSSFQTRSTGIETRVSLLSSEDGLWTKAGRVALLLLGLLLLLQPVHSQAQTILIHTGYLSSYNDPYEAEDGEWVNKLATWGSSTKRALVDTEKGATSLFWQTEAGFTNTVTGGPSSGLLGFPAPIPQYGFYLDSGKTASVILSGFEPGTLVDITFYATLKTTAASAIRGLTINVAGDDNAQEARTLALSATTAVSDEQAVLFSHLIADLEGTIRFNFTVPDGYARGHLNGVKIEVIPEPAFFSLLFAGGLCFFRRRGGRRV